MALGSVAGAGIAEMAYGNDTFSEIFAASYLREVLDISGAREIMVDSLHQSAVAPRLIGLLDSYPVSDLTALPLAFRAAAQNFLSNDDQRSDSEHFAHKCREVDVANPSQPFTCHLGADSLGES